MLPLEKRPQLLSTSRHISQGVMDVKAQSWDPNKAILSGTSELVAADPYELRIYAPSENDFWKVASASVSPADVKAKVKVKVNQAGPQVRITINSPQSRQVTWSVSFREK